MSLGSGGRAVPAAGAPRPGPAGTPRQGEPRSPPDLPRAQPESAPPPRRPSGKAVGGSSARGDTTVPPPQHPQRGGAPAPRPCPGAAPCPSAGISAAGRAGAAFGGNFGPAALLPRPGTRTAPAPRSCGSPRRRPGGGGRGGRSGGGAAGAGAAGGGGGRGFCGGVGLPWRFCTRMSLMCPMSSSRWNQSHSCPAIGTRGRGQGGGGSRRHRHRRLHRHRRRARSGAERAGGRPLSAPAAPRPAPRPSLHPALLPPLPPPPSARPAGGAGRSGRGSGRGLATGSAAPAAPPCPPCPQPGPAPAAPSGAGRDPRPSRRSPPHKNALIAEGRVPRAMPSPSAVPGDRKSAVPKTSVMHPRQQWKNKSMSIRGVFLEGMKSEPLYIKSTNCCILI